MKILHLSTNTHGGAGSAAARIHMALLKHGHVSQMVVRTNQNKIEKVKQTTSKGSYYWSRALRVLRSKLLFKNEYLMYSAQDTKKWFNIYEELRSLDFVPDIVILHWVADFVSYDELFDLRRKYPKSRFMWFVMDMAPFTSGCHYSWGCKGYVNNCNPCSGIKNTIAQNIINKMHSLKYNFLLDAEVQFIAPNKFVQSQITISSLAFKQIPIVYIPIDEDIFTSDRAAEAGFTILFGGGNLFDRRKGGDLFEKVLSIVDARLQELDMEFGQVKLLAPGIRVEDEAKFTRIKIVHSERATGDYELAQLYYNSDLFVCCSREDSGPMMVGEALMSGLPVVSFEVGAVRELITDPVAGMIVDGYDVEVMANEVMRYILKEKPLVRELVRETVFNKLSTKSLSSKFQEIMVNTHEY